MVTHYAKEQKTQSSKRDGQVFSSMSAYIFLYFIQQCFICRLSDFSVLEDAEVELRTVATFCLGDQSLQLSGYILSAGQLV
jgi:hypothetical protein